MSWILKRNKLESFTFYLNELEGRALGVTQAFYWIKPCDRTVRACAAATTLAHVNEHPFHRAVRANLLLQ